ncbi:hypothetical protein ACHAWF_006325 [Thalassiosira exigua]
MAPRTGIFPTVVSDAPYRGRSASQTFSSIMTASAASSAAPTKPAVRRRRRHDRNMPICEMRRLMDVYGPIKCLRKRHSAKGKGGKGNGAGEKDAAAVAKDDSIKRKFYRWFPDLDDRFEKNEAGLYAPKFGHDEEVRYRKEMRTMDGKTLAKKRNDRRQRRVTDRDVGRMSRSDLEFVMDAPTSFAPDDVPSVGRPQVSPEQGRGCAEREVFLEFDGGSDQLAEGASFVPEGGIFDDVEESFYGTPPRECPSVAVSTSSRSSSEDRGSSSSSCSWEHELPPLKDVLADPMGGCCFEDAAWGEGASGLETGFIFG